MKNGKLHVSREKNTGNNKGECEKPEKVNVQGVSHLSGIFSFSIRSQDLRRHFRNGGFVVTVRGGGRGGRRRRRRLWRIAGGQLGRGHVLIEVSVLIVRLLFQLAPPCVRTGVQRLRVLG